MAIINLTWDNVDGIVGEVIRVFNEKHNALMAEALSTPTGAGDDLMSWIVPREDNKKIMDAMPKWCKVSQKYIYVKVDVGNEDSGWTPIIKLPLTEDWFRYAGTWNNIGVKGTTHSTWDGQILKLYLASSTDLPQDRATGLVKSLYDIAVKHQSITEETNKAADTMREFLGQHRTLQTALKECPAVMSYVPDWMKQELNRVPPKRTRRPPIPKAEKKDIDMSQLVTEATISKLNL